MNYERVSIIHMDGVEWVKKSAYDAVHWALLEKQRSTASHNRYFAHLEDMFGNLPATHADSPYAKSSDAFRKHSLIQTGYCDIDTLALNTQKEAVAAAPFVAKLARKAHGYAITVVRGPLIVCSTPHSQSFKAMGKDAFHASVAACEDWAERTLGVKN
jgi:hypothetical protein